jgi:elongation factor Ts
MTDISAKEVMDLRSRTGVSMMMCKKALLEAAGDMEKAVEVLRKKGEAKAADKADRTTSEGGVSISVGDGKAAVISVLCETDFVSRNDDFKALTKGISDLILEKGPDAKEEAEAMVKDKVVQLGENIQLGSLELISGDVLGQYVHSNGKIGVVVALTGGDSDMATDVAMHAAAMNPTVVDPSEVSDEVIAKEKEIWTVQLKNEGKPENIIENILVGKEKKFREEGALLTQSFVKDGDKTVGEYLGDAKVAGYTRVSI